MTTRTCINSLQMRTLCTYDVSTSIRRDLFMDVLTSYLHRITFIFAQNDNPD
eukprot:gene5716-15787_t